MPKDFELNVRLSQAPDTDSDGSSAARACRTRASASVVRSVASSTTGVLPAARFTASANARRSGAVAAGAWAATDATPSTASTMSPASSRLLLLRDTMEIEVDMGVEIRPHVEPLRHAGRERPAHYRGVHQGRHREFRGEHHVHRPKLAVLDAALDYARHEAVPAGHHFVIVEARQLRKSCRFGHHQLGNTGERGLPDQLPVFPHQLFEQLAGAPREGLRQGFALGDHRYDGRPHHGLEQRFLVLEVEVNRALGDAGAAGHVGQRRARVAALDEYFERRRHELLGPRVFATLPARLGGALRGYCGVRRGLPPYNY